MRIWSRAFKDGEKIPKDFSCEGGNASPELLIEDVPPEAKSLALVMDDPDAPRGTFVHWLLWNIPPEAKLIPEGRTEGGALEGRNDADKAGYIGPCPPPGHGIHHYHFKLYALDGMLGLAAGAGKNNLVKEIDAHKITETELVGTYERQAA